MVRELLVKLKSKTIVTVATAVVSCAGVAVGAIWRLSADRASVGSDIRQHEQRLTELETVVSSLDERARAVERKVERIDSNVLWLREDAERKSEASQ